MITYREQHKVYLEGKYIGDIKEHADGFAYFPKGSKDHGYVYATVDDVKATL